MVQINKQKKEIKPNMNMKIYRADSTDIDLVVMLIVGLFKELNPRMMGLKEESEIYTAAETALEEDSKTIVYLAINENKKPISVLTLAEINSLSAFGRFGMIMEHYVIPEERAAGVGKSMIEAIKDYGKKRGWRLLQVATPGREMGQRSNEFYMNHGFEVKGNYLTTSLQE